MSCPYKKRQNVTGYGDLTAVSMNSAVTFCTSTEIHRRFGREPCLRLQDQRISHASKQQEDRLQRELRFVPGDEEARSSETSVIIYHNYTAPHTRK
jgi:hypothetical protein